MKIFPILFILGFSAYSFFARGQTNHISFASRPHEDTAADGSDPVKVIRAEGRFFRETLPADQYPEGNWGAVTNGIQMSTRVYETNCVIGKPVVAVILWRNASQTTVIFTHDAPPRIENYTFDLIMKRDGIPLPPRIPRLIPNWRQIIDNYMGAMPSGSYTYPNSQWRFTQRLDEIFDLNKTGFYELVVQDTLPGKIKVSSGEAKFWMVPNSEIKTNDAGGIK